MKYYITITFQGQEYRSVESYDLVSAAYDEAHRRFDGTPVQFDVFSEEPESNVQVGRLRQ